MTTPSNINAELLTYAQQYHHSANQQAVLEPFKEPILLLRAKYASYEIITETLNGRSVKVSVATVRKFCRRYNTEVKRLRAETEAERRTATANSKPVLSAMPDGISSSKESKRSQLTSEIGKRGPRIARDEL